MANCGVSLFSPFARLPPLTATFAVSLRSPSAFSLARNGRTRSLKPFSFPAFTRFRDGLTPAAAAAAGNAADRLRFILPWVSSFVFRSACSMPCEDMSRGARISQYDIRVLYCMARRYVDMKSPVSAAWTCVAIKNVPRLAKSVFTIPQPLAQC